MSTVAIIRINDWRYDEPTLRVLRWLRDTYDVKLISVSRGGKLRQFRNPSYIPDEVMQIDVGAFPYGQGMSSVFFRVKVFLKVFLVLKRLNPEVVYAIDLDALICGFAYKVFRSKTKLIFHEFDQIAEFESVRGKLISAAARRIEKSLIKFICVMVVPDLSRLERRELCIDRNKVIAIRNIPKIDYCPIPLRDEKKKNRIIINYVGGLSKDRFLAELVNAVSQNQQFYLEIAGRGVLADQLSELASKYGNVDFLGALERDEALESFARCDLMYACYDAKYSVNRVATPNKFYEALAFGKPILVSRGTGIDAVVSRENCGYIKSTANMSEFLTQISRERNFILAKNAVRAYEKFSEAAEQSKLLAQIRLSL